MQTRGGGIGYLNTEEFMFQNGEEQKTYIKETYPEVTDKRINKEHWDLHCPRCGTTRGFQVIERSEGRTQASYYNTYTTDSDAPIAIYFRCPVCGTYKQWIMYKISGFEGEGAQAEDVTRYYRVASLPSEGIEDIDEIPSEPPSLRVAYKQAVRSMDANAHIAAAAMFRRALQVITRQILGATPNNLAKELKEVVGKKYKGVTITNDFAEVGYIIKEAGNQGAHPDDDPDLLDFTEQDAGDLQKIFMEIVTDLFVLPEATKKTRENFLNRRKIGGAHQ